MARTKFDPSTVCPGSRWRRADGLNDRRITIDRVDAWRVYYFEEGSSVRFETEIEAFMHGALVPAPYSEEEEQMRQRLLGEGTSEPTWSERPDGWYSIESGETAGGLTLKDAYQLQTYRGWR